MRTLTAMVLIGSLLTAGESWAAAPKEQPALKPATPEQLKAAIAAFEANGWRYTSTKSPDGSKQHWFWNESAKDADLAAIPHVEFAFGLGLVGKKVTDAGLVHLKGIASLATLHLDDTPVTDAGLTHLKELKSLKTLDLTGAKVTNAGIAELRKALPNCEISN